MIDQSLEIQQGSGAPLPRQMALPLALIFYAMGFWLALRMGGGEGFYSVWFPAAGLRLAMLWHAGPKLTPAIAVVEMAVNWALGSLSFASTDWPMIIWSIVGPVLAYGGTIAMVRRWSNGPRPSVMTPPMPFGVAAVAAPSVAALTVFPEALLGDAGTTGRDVVTSLTAFAVGDLLGVLIIAPPLLWLAEIFSRGSKPWRVLQGRPMLPWKPILEVSLLLVAGLFAAALLLRADLGAQRAPLVLAVAWIGLRYGRLSVWIVLAIVTILMLPQTAAAFDMVHRLQQHFDFVTVVVTGYLAGSYRDAQKQARADLERRDRLLFQAERLKTLRAMSVAVIHEISQPLSTLAIEAKHLHEITAHSDPEIMQSAALIDRKATTLSNLVRRLRRFGGGAVDEPSPLPVAALIEGVVTIAGSEAKSEGVALKVGSIDPDLVVLAQEVELSQAVMNLLRNAIHAASDGTVEITSEQEGEEVRITVSNRCAPDIPAGSGMGVGTLVAQAIVEAHGGRLIRVKPNGHVVIASIILPLVGDAHEWR